MQQQQALLLVFLFTLQCTTTKSAINYQDLFEFTYTSEQSPEPVRMNVTTYAPSSFVGYSWWVLSSLSIDENIFFIDSIRCAPHYDNPYACSFYFCINCMPYKDLRLPYTPIGKFKDPAFRQLLLNLSSQPPSSKGKYNLTCRLLDTGPDDIKKPGGRDEDPSSTTNLLGIIFLTICIVFIFLLGVGWSLVSYCRKYKEHRREKKRRQALEQSTQEVLKQSPILIFDAASPEFRCSEEAEETCAICLETFRNKEQIRKLVCSHYFHVLCIDPWVLARQSCPLCNRNILRHSIPSISSSLMEAINNESTSIANQTLPNRS